LGLNLLKEIFTAEFALVLKKEVIANNENDLLRNFL
jgi:hypothetical protein